MNVQSGQLARVVGHPAQAHCIVRVGRLLTLDDAKQIRTLRFPAWECTALCHMPDNSGFIAKPGDPIWIADRALRPLPGDDRDTSADQGVETRDEVPA